MSNSSSSTNDPSNEVNKSNDIDTGGKNNIRNITTQKNNTTTKVAHIQSILSVTLMVIGMIGVIASFVLYLNIQNGETCKKGGFSPLFFACQEDKYKTVKLLLENTAKVYLIYVATMDSVPCI